MTRNSFDLAILGGGLTGLMLAHQLSKHVESLLIVHEDPSLAPEFHCFQLDNLKVSNMLRPLPVVGSLEKALEFFEIPHATKSTPLVWLQNGHLLKEAPADLLESLPKVMQSFIQEEQVELVSNLGALASSLREQLLMCKNVTHVASQKVKKLERVKSSWVLELEGRRRLQASRVMGWWEDPRGVALLPIAADSPLQTSIEKLRSRLAKSEYYTLVGLDFLSPMEDAESLASAQRIPGSRVMHIFEGVHIVGVLEEGRIWRWISALQGGQPADESEISSRLKLIKRSVQKIFPELVDMDRVYVSSGQEPGILSGRPAQTLGQDLRGKAFHWLVSQGSEWGAAGSILMAYRLASEIVLKELDQPNLDCPILDPHDSSLSN